MDFERERCSRKRIARERDCNNLYASTTNQGERQSNKNRKKSIKALSPLRPPAPFPAAFPGFLRPEATARPRNRSLHSTSSRDRHYHYPCSPSLQSARHKARRTQVSETERSNWSYPLNVRSGQWGTNNQHRGRSATWRNVRHTFRPETKRRYFRWIGGKLCRRKN